MTGSVLPVPDKPLHHVDQQVGQAVGQVGLGEEGGGVTVIDGPAPGQDFAQVGGEDRRVELPQPNVGVRASPPAPGFRGSLMLSVPCSAT